MSMPSVRTENVKNYVPATHKRDVYRYFYNQVSLSTSAVPVRCLCATSPQLRAMYCHKHLQLMLFLEVQYSFLAIAHLL